MAKRVIFLLIMLFVLLIASVTAFAADTEATTPEAGFTNDKATILKDFSISELEKTYGDIFFGEDTKSDVELITVSAERPYGLELRYNFSGSAIVNSTDKENPMVMILYIKEDGKYVPLNDVDTKRNMTGELNFTNSVVDLKYLGSDKVNEIRVIAFRKKDVQKLQLNKNIQVKDMKITARPWTLIEKIKITWNNLTMN